MNSASFNAKLGNLAAIRCFVEDAAQELLADPHAVEDMIQAVDEAATNIINHGYAGKPGKIEITVQRRDSSLVVHLVDQAPHFDPLQVPPPDLTLSLVQRCPGGLGIYFIRKFMDEVRYTAIPQGGNELTLVKKAFDKGETG
jgi:anti-sigma regulatory factor (Ser/Thr protein kinase)